MSNREKAYKEVYTILQDLNEEEYNKIPPEVINAIKNNMDNGYAFELDDELELKEQQMLPETKAILFNLFRDYLATEQQRQKVIEMQNEERQKLELKKQEKYNTNVFENKSDKRVEEVKEVTDMVEYKENIFKRIFNIIKLIFKKK